MSIFKKSVRYTPEDFEDNSYSAVFSHEQSKSATHEENIQAFEQRLVHLLPQIGGDEDKIIQIEVLVALSVEGILTVDNLVEKAPMVKALCEMIKFDPEKKSTAIEIARRLLKA